MGVPFLFLKVYKISTPVSNRNHFMFSKGNRREEMTTDDADLTGIFRSRRNGRNSGNDERVRTKLYLYSLCRARRRKTIVKFDSQSDWREDIFYIGRNGNKTEKRKRCL